MAIYEMKMVLQYAKVFAENADMGDPESSQKWLRELHKNGGQTSVNAYFIDKSQIEKLENEGFVRVALNPQTREEVDRIKDGAAEFGIGQYLTMKRRITDVKEFKDRKTGQFVEKDYGGLPNVVDYRNGPEGKRLWSFEEDGPLGNGTKAVVQFEVYNGTTVRLMNLAVLEHVAYDYTESETGSEMFKVA